MSSLLNNITFCLDNCSKQNVISIDLATYVIVANIYRKQDFDNQDFDSYTIKTLIKENEESGIVYRHDITKEENIKRIKEKINNLNNSLTRKANFLLINKETCKLLFNYSTTGKIQPTNILSNNMNVYVVDEKIIGKNVLIISKTNQNQEGYYSVINQKKNLFKLEKLGDGTFVKSFKLL